MQSWEDYHISYVTLLTAPEAHRQLLRPKPSPKPNPPSLTTESSTRSSNEFKLEKQGYKQVTTNAGMWDIIPLILDLEASLNFAIGSKRPHRELKTVEKHNSDKYGYESAHTLIVDLCI